MSSPSQLTLDYCKPHHSYTDHQPHSTYKLEEFVSRLEEERLKIDAFKRELPLCMQLLTNAMEASRQQLEAYRGNQGSRAAVVEEFIPLKHYSTVSAESSEKASSLSDKANWMTSAQLWSQTSEETKPQSTVTASPKEAEIGFGSVSPKLALDNTRRRINGGGAFLPFSKERSSSLPELALASAEKEMEDKKCPGNPKKDSSGQGGSTNGRKGNNTVSCDQQKTTSNTTTSTSAAATTQTHRKARRCWSPDLHRRFVNALQMLGGSQVATPKQIRELMKVDGLTNDEVKSHLQKYRLHTRRPSPNPQGAGGPSPQLVVLGGIWVPPEYGAATAATHTDAANALFNFNPHTPSHVPLQHYCTTTPVSQEFYTAALSQPPHSHTLHHHRLQMYKTTSHTQRSRESEARGMGERSESIEDGKSESSSWKQGESGENEGARTGVVALEEASNVREISLKF